MENEKKVNFILIAQNNQKSIWEKTLLLMTMLETLLLMTMLMMLEIAKHREGTSVYFPWIEM